MAQELLSILGKDFTSMQAKKTSHSLFVNKIKTS
jgi:hypothetical protein